MRRTTRNVLALFALAVTVACGATVASSSPQDDAGVSQADAAALENKCRAAGGVCITTSTGLVCARTADRAAFPCAPNQGADIVCCLPEVVDAGGIVDAGADVTPDPIDSGPNVGPRTPSYNCIDRPAEQVDAGLSCVSGSWMTGCPGTCMAIATDNGQLAWDASTAPPANAYTFPCAAGCSCSSKYDCYGRAGVCGGRYAYCDCPSDPQPGTCTPVNCGSVHCPPGGICLDGGVCAYAHSYE